MKVKLDPGAYAPVRAHILDAGLDIRSPIDAKIGARDSIVINTGVHVAIPIGYVGMLKSKSGLNVKFDITSEGVIDSGYTGSIVVKLYNNGDGVYQIARGDKVTQLVILPISVEDVEIVDELPEFGERGSNGFGSTGK